MRNLYFLILCTTHLLAHGVGYGKYYSQFYFLMIFALVFFILNLFYGIIKGVQNKVFIYLLFMPFLLSILGIVIIFNLEK